MFVETANTPTEICAVVEATTRKRKASILSQTVGQSPSAEFASSGATALSQLKKGTSRAGNTKTDGGQIGRETHDWSAVVGSPIIDRNCGPAWSSGHVTLKPYEPTPEVTEAVAEIVQLHRLRQATIKAQTKLALQGQAVLRFLTQSDEDFASDEAKEKARKRNESLYRQVVSDPTHEFYVHVMPYLLQGSPLDDQRTVYEKAMVKAVKRLPVYEWVKGVKGFGDISFATIVGECGDIGTYKSVSAVWKRLGLAVINGRRQGAPGEGATKEDWIEHGYNKQRRSVSWNARKGIIGSNGLWRPAPGEDVMSNPELTYYQRLYAERARSESIKLGLPVKEKVNAKGVLKESYTQHVSNRAHRYVEKRLIKHLYIEWRRAA